MAQSTQSLRKGRPVRKQLSLAKRSLDFEPALHGQVDDQEVDLQSQTAIKRLAQQRRQDGHRQLRKPLPQSNHSIQ